jgi:plastocyanin
MSEFPRQLPLSVAVACALLPAAPPVPAAAATHVVVIDQMKYSPIPPLKVGDTVVFENRDLFRHTVTASNNSFNLDLIPGARGSLHINTAGHAAFYCKYHPGMRGTMEAK